MSLSSDRPRIAICGLHSECSTFSAHLATADDFIESRGETLLARYPWLTRTPRPNWAEAVEWIPILHARAMPGGPVVREAYDRWKEEIVAKLAQEHEHASLDGIYFDIHGAINVVGLDDAEGDLITAIRQVVGPDVWVGCTMDLHGNVSTTLFKHCDQMTCFRLAPHEDTWETRERGARNLAEGLLSKAPKPHKALVHVPILLPGEMTSTRLEPAKSLYGSIARIVDQIGITDASIWIGYAWADEPRNKGVVMVYGDDAELVDAEALRLAKHFWKVRHEFEFVAPADQFEPCLQQAIAAPADQRPFFISDSGDNPGAGGADDVTFALEKLLAADLNGLQATYASIVDPHAVAEATAAGIGSTVTLHVGGKIDTREPGELSLTGTVGAISENDPEGGTTIRLDIGTVHVIITSIRTQYATLDMYRRLDIEPTDQDIIVVKIGYLEPELHAIQRGWLLALTPGGVDQDLIRLGHNRIERPMYPWDRDMADPQWTVLH